MTLTPTDLRPGSGDHLIIYDSSSNLEWLKLSATYSHSYIEIQNGFGGYIGSMGFRFAEGNEVTGLFAMAGVSKFGGPDPLSVDPKNDVGVETMLDILGGRCIKGMLHYAQGQIVTGCIDQQYPTSDLAVLGLFYEKLTSPVNAYADGGYGEFYAGKAMPDVGAFLVRKRTTPCKPRKKS